MKRKYGNRIAYVGDLRFDSQKEMRYYLYLRELEKRGGIKNLRLQVPFELVPPVYEERVKHLKTRDKITRHLVQPAIRYIADFVYDEDGVRKVVDVKSEATKADKVYILKKKMMRALLGITIEEI